MSTLKSILHHWDSSSSSYDTLHPETEKAQVTDWAQGIVDTLASTALGSLISTLSSDSLMAKLVKLVLNATGVKYLMGTNGYICFGSLFGGLIIQWIYSQSISVSGSTASDSVTLPISFSSKCLVAFAEQIGGPVSTATSSVITGTSVNSVSVKLTFPSNSSQCYASAIAIGV